MWEANLFAIALLGSLVGVVLCTILLIACVGSRSRSADRWLLALTVAGAAAWHACHALSGFLTLAGKGWTEPGSRFLLDAFAFAAAAPLLHLSLWWASGFNRTFLRAGFILYPAVLLVWSSLFARPQAGRFALGAALLSAVAALFLAGRRAGRSRRVLRLSLAALLLPLALSVLLAANPAWSALASLLPLLGLIVLIHRYNVLGLLISRRVLFVFTLSLVSALYLIVARFLADWSAEFGAFGPLVQTALILAAAFTWLPVYQVITRFFSRQNRIRAEFSRGLIEEAAAILDLRHRARYLVDQVGRAFQLRRAALLLGADPPDVIASGSQEDALPPSEARPLLQWIASQPRGAIHALDALNAREAGSLLHRTGYNYAFPLYYQDRFTGALLLDTSPRAFLDDAEDTLLSLSGQISLSLESCRLSESKAALEKELIEKQHLATLGGLAATIAHEVKNPLSSIKTLAQLLREDSELLEKYGQELGFIVSETNRLSSCVQQLLTFARPLPAANEEIALSELLENSTAFISVEDAQPGVHIRRRIEPGLRLTGSDRKSIEQIVLNLILNALQASPAGGCVDLDVRSGGDGAIRLSVQDQGPGIPAEIRARVFEPFFTTKRQGAGLGLAIVRKHVQHLGAELELQSPVSGGCGACISVRFPKERVAAS